jgi:hypothetical protein
MRPPNCAAVAYLPSTNILTWFSAGPGGFGTEPGAFGPPVQPYGAPPPRKSSKLWLWLLLGLGGIVVAGVVCCGAIGMWGMGAVNNLMTKGMQAELGGNPVIQEHIGEIQSVSVNFAETQKMQGQGQGQDAAVMDIKGSKGQGQLLMTPVPGGEPKVELKLPGGETVLVK